MLERSFRIALPVMEGAGLAAGLASAPIFGLLSWLRGGRVFHPEGTCFWWTLSPTTRDHALARVAERLGTRALVRLSAGLWRGTHERFEALGCAVRFTDHRDRQPRASRGDQDLLFATFDRPATLLLAPFFTDARDYLANVYDAAAPFEVEGFGLAFLRLVPARGRSPAGIDREDRLERAFAAGRTAFRLELRRFEGGPWLPVGTLELRERALVDQEVLRFSPYRAGRGVRPRGFVQASRLAAYAASQWARPAGGRRREEARPVPRARAA